MAPPLAGWETRSKVLNRRAKGACRCVCRTDQQVALASYVYKRAGGGMQGGRQNSLRLLPKLAISEIKMRPERMLLLQLATYKKARYLKKKNHILKILCFLRGCSGSLQFRLFNAA